MLIYFVHLINFVISNARKRRPTPGFPTGAPGRPAERSRRPLTPSQYAANASAPCKGVTPLPGNLPLIGEALLLGILRKFFSGLFEPFFLDPIVLVTSGPRGFYKKPVPIVEAFIHCIFFSILWKCFLRDAFHHEPDI